MDGIKQQAEQAIVRKAVSSVLSQFLLQFLLPGFCPAQVPALTSFSDGLLPGSIQ